MTGHTQIQISSTHATKLPQQPWTSHILSQPLSVVERIIEVGRIISAALKSLWERLNIKVINKLAWTVNTIGELIHIPLFCPAPILFFFSVFLYADEMMYHFVWAVHTSPLLFYFSFAGCECHTLRENRSSRCKIFWPAPLNITFNRFFLLWWVSFQLKKKSSLFAGTCDHSCPKCHSLLRQVWAATWVWKMLHSSRLPAKLMPGGWQGRENVDLHFPWKRWPQASDDSCTSL